MKKLSRGERKKRTGVKKKLVELINQLEDRDIKLLIERAEEIIEYNQSPNSKAWEPLPTREKVEDNEEKTEEEMQYFTSSRNGLEIHSRDIDELVRSDTKQPYPSEEQKKR